jgi:molybdopterin-guanine dinucleotide biosynthesis protein A
VYDAIVVAGGAARRLDGADKPALEVGGRSLLDLVLDAVSGAGRIVVVGPTRPVHRAVTWTLEQPVGGGPVAAIAAGLAEIRAGVVVVLAADLPFVAPAVPVLLSALDRSGVDVAALADPSGQVNYLAAAWRSAALRTAHAAAMEQGGSGVPVRALFGSATMITVTDRYGWGRDCDTWSDLAAARREIAENDRAGDGAGQPIRRRQERR